MFRQAAFDVFGCEDQGTVLSQSVGTRHPEDDLSAATPPYDPPVRIEKHDGVLLRLFYQETEQFVHGR